MAKQEYMSFGRLQPGDVIKLSDITELPVFEDLVADQVDPTMTQKMHEAWSGRVAVRDLLRPPKFNGTIADIELVAMDQPFERLCDARERGWKFNHKGKAPTNLPKDERVIESFRGFTFLAEARSSGRGIIGQIQAELWYGRVPYRYYQISNQLKSGASASYDAISKTTGLHGGTSVHRYVTAPKIETEKFIALDERARRVGLAVLLQNMQHPIVQPFHN